MKPTDNNKDKGKFLGQQNRNQGQSGQRATDKPTQNPQGAHGQKGVGGKILSEEDQFKAGHSGQNPQGNFQQGQKRFQGDQGKMKNENRDINKEDASDNRI
ncbi:MAG: hypothetical protein ABWY22_12960 [Flavobacterium sp.]